ncbi:hypothetical protein PV367_12695 [Streptomyces europaeiscabiei]|uniref:Uncharacterized protein n=1 Tax=Streptomyces europaeiscabiei TaxID=146819 RepID=A0AAJ2PNB7_9ACTN|nr:hypothetical protein [Streptomyces europaeiscabiei]MDX3130632.1 hypothetical protein [Streptomyces europaeiscabiei]
MITAEGYIGSADFWNTVIGGMVGILLGVVTTRVSVKASNPKRRLQWQEVANVSLLRISQGAGPSTISVSHASGPLAEPRVAQIVVTNLGMRDVHPDDFTLGDDSFVFNFQVPIVEVIGSYSLPDSSPTPQTEVSGNLLKIKKSPIATGQKIFYTALLDGPEKQTKLGTQSIRDTPIKNQKPPKSITPVRTAGMALGALCAVLALFIAINTAFGGDWPISQPSPTPEQCRSWDKYKPEKSAKECPEIKKP